MTKKHGMIFVTVTLLAIFGFFYKDKIWSPNEIRISFSKVVVKSGVEFYFVAPVEIVFRDREAMVSREQKLVPGEYDLQLEDNMPGQTLLLAQRPGSHIPNVYLANEEGLRVPPYIRGKNIAFNWYTASDTLTQEYEKSPPYPFVKFRTQPDVYIYAHECSSDDKSACVNINGQMFHFMIFMRIKVIEFR